MAYTLEIDTDSNLVTIRVDGAFRLDDIRDYRARIAGDERFRADMARLIDLRSSHVEFTTDDVIAASRLWTSEKLASKMAVVVPSEASYGMIRMFQMWAQDDRNVRVFYDMTEALEWLGASPVDPS